MSDELIARLPDIAAYFARRGWAVYPQAPETNAPRRNCPACRERRCPGPHAGCPCLASVENPCHALHAASSDVELTICRWERAARCNPAARLDLSGAAVLDLDDHGGPAPAELAPGLPNPGGIHNGVQAWEVLADHLGISSEPETLTVETPTGGKHIYFRAPRALTKTVLAAWQVELKAGCTSITLPGSVRRVGGDLVPYQRVSDTVNLAPFPRELGEWLVSIGRVPDPTRPATPTVMPTQRTSGDTGHHSPAWWARAWRDQLAEIESAPPGERYHTLGRRAGRLFALTERPGCPWTADDAERALVEAQERRAVRLGVPVSTSEYRAQVRSMREYATRHYGLSGVAR